MVAAMAMVEAMARVMVVATGMMAPLEMVSQMIGQSTIDDEAVAVW